MSAGEEGPQQPWSKEEVHGANVSKKDLVEFLQATASTSFLRERKLHGKAPNVIKTAKKPELAAAYEALFAARAFRDPEAGSLEEELERLKLADAADAAATAAVEAAVAEGATESAPAAAPEAPQYTKVLLKKGDPTKPVIKGKSVVSCFYTGYLPDGEIFDTNLPSASTTGKKARKPVPLRFRVGVGRVIRGWDEALLTMHKGERARLVVCSSWAYGKKGAPPKIPPNTDLTFELELHDVE